MGNPTRRAFLRTASFAVFAAAGSTHGYSAASRQRVFVGTNGHEGILLFDWDPATGQLVRKAVAAELTNADWITFSPDRQHMFAASEVESFNGKPTGAVVSYRVDGDKLTETSAQNSAAKGTCWITLDHTGRMAISADYGGGAAASFRIENGKLSPAVWTEHYTQHGPNRERQAGAHAHSARFSPDNRYAYINDLGGDCIHIYRCDPATAGLTHAGKWEGKPGSGPRTLRFHPNGVTAYCMNELTSTVVVLHWNQADGSLTAVHTIDLLTPEDIAKGLPTRGCDTVISRDGRFVYFANRDVNFLYAFHADPKTGALTPMKRSSCGGKIPRNFALDPSERWMLVANQDSNVLSVFARNPDTGELAEQGHNYDCPGPMCILFA